MRTTDDKARASLRNGDWFIALTNAYCDSWGLIERAHYANCLHHVGSLVEVMDEADRRGITVKAFFS